MAFEYMRTDAILMEILRERKTITGFLDAIFGFLKRNTDFYHIKEKDDERIGFQKGVREKILFGGMQRYDPECSLNNLITSDEDSPEFREYVPFPAEEVEIETEQELLADEELVQTSALDNAESEEILFSSADYKNGAKYKNYCWSQTIKDVEVHVVLPSGLKNAKQVAINLRTDSITVESRLSSDIILTGKLANKYKYNDVVWTIAEGRLQISFDKSKEIWWDKLFVSENPIDLQKLDCECFIDELPDESQAVIQKLRAQQLQQDQTQVENSREKSETLEKLRKAWDAEGSPFRGQPYDPSIVKFS